MTFFDLKSDIFLSSFTPKLTVYEPKSSHFLPDKVLFWTKMDFFTPNPASFCIKSSPKRSLLTPFLTKKLKKVNIYSPFTKNGPQIRPDFVSRAILYPFLLLIQKEAGMIKRVARAFGSPPKSGKKSRAIAVVF
jgi:hypothetical protein